MLHSMKKAIQRQLYNACYDKYRKETAWQKDRYAAYLKQCGEPAFVEAQEWKAIAEQAALRNASKEEGTREKEPDRMLTGEGKLCRIFRAQDGLLSPEATAVFDEYFRTHPESAGAYAHEDYAAEDGRRHHPWFKPVFSPDTLADSFYIGNIFAIRRECCPDGLGESLEREAAIELFLQTVIKAMEGFICQKREKNQENGNTPKAVSGIPDSCGRDALIGLVDQILFHKYGEDTLYCDAEPETLAQDNPLALWLNNSQTMREGFAAEVFRMGVRTALQARKLVSVIIPSKDNPAVLQTCIQSVKEKTTGIGYEVIVVDNGSSEENRAFLEQMAETEGFRYVYKRMAFNFSAMCNLGAREACCDYLLFLNDDMEVIGPDWMLKLYERASLLHAGAVGAKLLYPDSDLIQHAGVTNLKAGPAHKLLKEHDEQSFYHGKNRGVHDMLAVTAACLMVEKDKFLRAGGFCEDIAVSYNDVDFCFTLYEMGLYNIQCNDVTLYHHESLSRGDDNLSEKKWERLLQEKNRLYARHPKLKGFDPFYSEHLAGHFSDYLCSFEYDYEKRDCYTRVRAFWGKEPVQWYNNCLSVTVEHARRERRLDLTEEKEVLWIEGWSYILNVDNCRYDRELLLFGENGRNYRADLMDRYREDVVEILPEQKQVALAGFTCRMPEEKLEAGSYRIAMLAKDRCSGQKLYQSTDAVLVVQT